MTKISKSIFGLFFWGAFSLNLHAQIPVPDSLAAKIQNTTGLRKAEAYYEAVFQSLLGQLPSAKHFVEESERFAAAEKNPVVFGYASLSRGIYSAATGKLDSAILSLEKAKEIFKAENAPIPLIKTESSLGKTYISLGKPEKGLENLYAALSLLASHPNRESELKVRVNIMWAYLELKRHAECIRVGRSSLPLVDLHYEWMLPYFYNNLAVSYGSLNQVDSARYFIEKSIPIARKYDENAMLANAHFIIGNLYATLKQYKPAVEEFLKAKPYREKVGDPFYIVSDQYTLADLYSKMGDHKKGIAEGLQALQLAEEHNLILKFESIYQALAKNYEGLGDFKNASHYYNLWATAKDSVYKNATAQAIAEMQTKYESEKKEQQILVQNLQLEEQKTELQNTYIILAALIIITLLVIVILILARNRFKRKQELLKKESEIQVRETYLHATLQSQEKERKRFAQDLHDSMGQLISALRLVLSPKDNHFNEQEVISNSDRILKEMHKEIRSVSFNLMPQTLIQLGLLPALEEMASRINQAGKLKVSLSGFGLPARLTELQEISLFRILQEWTNNCLKHSNATTMNIQLVRHEDEILVTAEDNGMGFDSALLEAGEGNGWKNIQSRLKAMKGHSEIDTRADRFGSTFIAHIPV